MSWWRAGLAALGVEVLVAAALTFVMGVPAPWAVSIALPIAALTVLAIRTPTAVEPRWSPLPPTASAATFPQASTLSSRLADAVGDRHRSSSRIQPRLRALALARLRQQSGFGELDDLTDPSAVLLLGEPLVRLLTDHDAELPTPARLTELLTKLEDL